MPRAITRPIRHLCRDRRGVAAVEFAIIATIMVTLMLGAYDFGNAAQEQVALQEAVRAGGAYAQSRPSDLTGIRNSVANALPAGWALSNAGGVAAVACFCLNPATGVTTPLGSCTDANLSSCTGANIGKVVTVTATMPYTHIGSLFAAVIPNNTAQYAARIQ
jgi:Flp pilus assembly protein TadG